MARLLSDQEIQDLAATIIADSDEDKHLSKLPTEDLKAWLDQGKIKYSDEDLKALEDELVGFYGLNHNESLDEATRKSIKDYPFVMHWSDGMRQAKGGNTYMELIKEAQKLKLKSFEIFKQAAGFHSTTQDEFLVGWYDEDGNTYWSNRAKKEPDLNDRKIRANDGSGLTGVEEAKKGPAKLVTESIRALIEKPKKIEPVNEGLKFSDLEKGKKYTYTGGAEIMEVTYVGLSNRNPDKKPGSSMGKGFLFQWPDGKYFELGAKSISEFIEETEMPESVQEGMAPEDLIKDGKYSWSGGEGMMPVTYVGTVEENPDLPIAMEVEGGYIFSFDDEEDEDGKYLSISAPVVEKHIAARADESKSINEAKGEKYPMLVEFDEKDEIVIHPAFAAMKAGEPLESFKVMEEFDDDHLPCVNCKAVIGGKTYRFSEWWIGDKKVIKKMYMAEAGDRGAMQGVKNYFVRNGNALIKNHKEHMKEVGAAKAAEEAKQRQESSTSKIKMLEEEYNSLIGNPKSAKRMKEIEKALAKLIPDRKLNDNGGLPFKKPTNEAVDDEYFQVESKLKDVCFQYYQQAISQEDAVQQINEIIKDSEDLQNVLVNVAPEAMIDAVISYYNWTESDLAESIDNVSDESEAKLRDIVAKFYAGLLPNTEAIEKSKEILDTCDDSGLKEVTEGLEDENLMYEIMRYFKWDVYDLMESASAE